MQLIYIHLLLKLSFISDFVEVVFRLVPTSPRLKFTNDQFKCSIFKHFEEKLANNVDGQDGQDGQKKMKLDLELKRHSKTTC